MNRVLVLASVLAVLCVGCEVYTIDGGSPAETISREQYITQQYEWCLRTSERTDSVSPGDMEILWLEAARGWQVVQAGGPYK